MKKLISIIFIIILLFSINGCQSAEVENETDLNENNEKIVDNEVVENENKLDEFIEFIGEDMNNNEVTDNIFSENTVTMVNIWGTTCPPCIDEMPYLEEINNELSDKDFQIVGMVAGGKAYEEEAKDLLEKLNVDGEILDAPTIGALSKEEYLKIINNYLK